MSNKIQKTVSALKNGIFFNKINHKFLNIYHITNKNVLLLQDECTAYNHFKKKYASTIAKGVNTGEQEHSNNVWICWFQGMENAPELVRACYQSVKKYLPDKDIKVITSDNLSEFVTFPDFILEKQKAGIIPFAQYSDLIRVALLTKYGGTWIDSTVLLTGSEFPEYTMTLPLFVFKQLQLSNNDINPIICSNWYISAYSNSKILTLTRNLCYEYWKTHNYLENYFIFHIFLTLAAERYPEEWNTIPMFNNHSPHELLFELGNDYTEDRWMQIKRATDIHKLTRHINYCNHGKSFYDHIIYEYSSPQISEIGENRVDNI